MKNFAFKNRVLIVILIVIQRDRVLRRPVLEREYCATMILFVYVYL
jgi:hypothetical protein